MKKSDQIKNESETCQDTLPMPTPQREDGEEAGSSNQTKQQTRGDSKPPLEIAADNDVPDTAQPHSHRFTFCFNDGNVTEVTCRKIGTIWESLQRNRGFQRQWNARKGPSAIIRRPGLGYITKHFPCSLIKDENLIIYTGDTALEETISHSWTHEDLPVTFTVATTCHPKSNLKTVLQPKLKRCDITCVYGFMNETVLSALKRDGRFHENIFVSNCQLKTLGPNVVSIELDDSLNCSDVYGRHFEFLVQEKTPRQHTMPDKKSKTKSTLAQPPCTETRDIGETSDLRRISETNMYEIPGTKELLKSLCDQLKKVLEHHQNRGSDLDFIKEEFLKYSEGFSVKVMEEVMNLSSSVCIVHAGNKLGTGFLLFSNCILTNAHVINDIYNKENGTLQHKVVVCFNEETKETYDVHHTVLAYGYDKDIYCRYVDFALLKLTKEHIELKPLLRQYISPRSGPKSICMIGHPNSGEKKIDIAVMIMHEQGELRIENGPYLTWSSRSQCPQIQGGADIITYDTCFGHGSSGSPVFNSEGRLVAVHTGTLHYENQQCVMEYAIPMHSILENIIIILVEKNLVNPLVSLLIDVRDNEHVKQYYNTYAKTVREDPSQERLLNTINNVDKQIHDREPQQMETNESS